ncbi:MAG TPA: XRE family transcriptional regulator [Acidimicrobiales bacterium]|nr:XRE family transcriptional regulator [Acidimicrobiales bacterium]
MLDQQEVASLVRSRLRDRRVELGLSIDDLAERSLVNASTISRIETGRRLPGLNHLVPLANTLGLSLDELVAPPDPSDVVIRPEPEHADGLTYWQLTRHEQPGLPHVFKLALPARRARMPEELPTHPGREWLYVLSGTLRLVLGDRELLVPAGSTASFDTSVPHWLGAHDGPAELLCIFDHQAERTHLPSN